MGEALGLGEALKLLPAGKLAWEVGGLIGVADGETTAAEGERAGVGVSGAVADEAQAAIPRPMASRPTTGDLIATIV